MRTLNFNWALTALALVATAIAQPSQNTFKSSDGAFEFRYPKSFVLCRPIYDHQTTSPERSAPHVEPQPNGWTRESCSPYMDICPTSLTQTTSRLLHPEMVACVAYSRSNFDGTNFGGAAFSVREVPDARTESDCLQFDRMTTNPGKAYWKTIGGVKFKANTGGEGGLGHGMSEAIYLTFHIGKCYDIESRTTGTSFANFDPGTIKEFTDYARVDRELRRILNSFRFLK